MLKTIIKRIILVILMVLYLLMTLLDFDYIRFWKYYILIAYFLITFFGNILISITKINKKFKIFLWIILNFTLVLFSIIEIIIYLVTSTAVNYNFVDAVLDCIPSLFVPNWLLPEIIGLGKDEIKRMRK